MASFDVTNLFTNVPLNETTNIILDNYNPCTFYNIAKETLKKLLIFATSESIFIYKDKIFSQIDGVSMGSPLGPTYANIFMCSREREWLADCPLNFKPLHYKRYVDDTFLIFRNQSHIDQFLNYINSKHPKIKFTCEREVNSSLPFLDVRLTKTSNGTISTGVYRKTTFTGQSLNWFSFCPLIYKINSIKTLINRAYNLTSNYQLFHKEIQFLKEFFISNNYSSETFYKLTKSFITNKYKPTIDDQNVPKSTHYIKLPFYGHIISEECKKQLNSLLNNSFPAINFKFIFTNNYRISSFFNTKTKLPNHIISNICYQFQCSHCSVRYIGCTLRSFNTRIHDHLGKSYQTGNFNHLHSKPYENMATKKSFILTLRFQNSS